MKKNLTEIVFILDRSGSMYSFVDDTIGGFNSMIEKYKTELEEAYITTVLFDDRYQILHDHLNLKEINPITRKEYYVDGCTALYDAVGKTINSVGERLFNTPEDERPEKVIFVINTDGYENASREFTRSKVKEMIEHQQEKYSWGFLFLGTNIDAEKEAESIGISRDFAATYAATSDGLTSSYDAACDTVMYMATSCDSISACACEAKAILNSKIVSGKTDYINGICCDDTLSSKADTLALAYDYLDSYDSSKATALSQADSSISTLESSLNAIPATATINAHYAVIEDADVRNLFA